MPIKGLTDRATLKPRLPRLGKLRKGDEKKGNKPGEDLDHFRFTSDDSEIVAAFHEIYGEKPRVINTVMYYETYEECFASWIETWDASGMLFRSDGEHWLVWREGDKYKRGRKPHKDHSDQKEVGRLEFVIPELWAMGFRGTVTLETSSNHDLRNIGGVLLAAEQAQQARGENGLRECPFILRRVQREISVPGWGDRKGKRSKAKKWLCELQPPRRILLASGIDDMPALPPGNVDTVTGEILDVTPTPEMVTPPIDASTVAWALAQTTTKGTKFADLDTEKLTWINDNPGQASKDQVSAAMILLSPEAADIRKEDAIGAALEETADKVQAEVSNNGYPGAMIQAVVEAGHANHPKHATAMLNKSKAITPETDTEQVVAWAARYRDTREVGGDAKQAVKAADKILS